jgi:hypothetical protein
MSGLWGINHYDSLEALIAEGHTVIKMLNGYIVYLKKRKAEEPD